MRRVVDFSGQKKVPLLAGENGSGAATNGKGKKTNWAGCVVVLSFLTLALAIASMVVGVIGVRTANAALGKQIYDTGGEIGSRPVTHILTGAILPMTLPNDLSDYVGITYSVNSEGLYAHTVTISAGTESTTWDGTNTVATFAGAAKGEGFTFTVVSKDTIRVGSTSGVTFS